VAAATSPRLARRAAIRCPHTGKRVEIELLMTPTGAPCRVLRCTIRPECPTTWDQACRDLAEAVVGPAVALLVLPAGHRELLFPRKGSGVHETGAVHLRALAFRPACFAPSSGIRPNPSRRRTRPRADLFLLTVGTRRCDSPCTT